MLEPNVGKRHGAVGGRELAGEWIRRLAHDAVCSIGLELSGLETVFVLQQQTQLVFDQITAQAAVRMMFEKQESGARGFGGVRGRRT